VKNINTKKIIVFDIDNTLCKTTKLDYDNSKPYKQKIKLVNKLYQYGHTINIYTSRYMGKHNGNTKIIYKKYYKKTIKQLKSWKLKFHKLIMCKPIFDIFVDDKAFNVNDKNLYTNLKKLLKKDD